MHRRHVKSDYSRAMCEYICLYIYRSMQLLRLSLFHDIMLYQLILEHKQMPQILLITVNFVLSVGSFRNRFNDNNVDLPSIYMALSGSE